MYKNDNTVKNQICFEQLSSGIYACHFCENNQQVCIDCLKPRSYKNKFECKNYGSAKFYVLDYQDSSFKKFPSL